MQRLLFHAGRYVGRGFLSGLIPAIAAAFFTNGALLAAAGILGAITMNWPVFVSAARSGLEGDVAAPLIIAGGIVIGGALAGAAIGLFVDAVRWAAA